MSQPKLGQIGHIGGVLKMSGPAEFKSVPGFENLLIFVEVIKQNKICNPFCQYCISNFSVLVHFVGLKKVEFLEKCCRKDSKF